MPTTDPQALRALAHPLRWQLLDLLDTEISATATRCSQVTGESVASCAYHLGILAKYGYVEQEPRSQGREKPWRLLSRRQELRPEGLGEEGELAAEAALDAFLDHELARYKTRLRAATREEPGWQPQSIGTTIVMTSAELAEVREAIAEVLLRFVERDGRPELYPAGGRPVRMFAMSSVAPATVPAAGSTSPSGSPTAADSTADSTADSVADPATPNPAPDAEPKR